MSLSDTQRIEILILLGCGDKTRTQKQVCEIFNTKYLDRRISQSTVSRIENKFREFGNVTDIPKSGRKRILDDEQKWDILLDIQDNPHKPTRQVAADNEVKHIKVSAYWTEKYELLASHLEFLVSGSGPLTNCLVSAPLSESAAGTREPRPIKRRPHNFVPPLQPLGVTPLKFLNGTRN
ncbi:hypothetical protein NQ318_006580 [Aromia moschata]|uniref:DUF4817 domain-containing protein n=1 Tax=Aromia moschata TaxID=1265417 RepID=A0AAV8YPX4_9CUCU|nr:hypothetical protein NQ318_006580 [Aromia moschata]